MPFSRGSEVSGAVPAGGVATQRTAASLIRVRRSLRWRGPFRVNRVGLTGYRRLPLCPPSTDIVRSAQQVRFVPTSDSCGAAKSSLSDSGSHVAPTAIVSPGSVRDQQWSTVGPRGKPWIGIISLYRQFKFCWSLLLYYSPHTPF